jgi:hypothetical protein
MLEEFLFAIDKFARSFEGLVHVPSKIRSLIFSTCSILGAAVSISRTRAK